VTRPFNENQQTLFNMTMAFVSSRDDDVMTGDDISRVLWCLEEGLSGYGIVILSDEEMDDVETAVLDAFYQNEAE